MEVEDDVELADVAIVFVHLFDVTVHNFQSDEFVVGGVAASDEEERRVAAVDNLCVCSKLASVKVFNRRGWLGSKV